MRRREFMTLLGGAAAWPVVAQAQRQGTASIGFLSLGTLDDARRTFASISRGLAEFGYVEGQNLAVQYRCADYHPERLAALAGDLVQSRVAAIIAPTMPSIAAARGATTTIPVVFFSGFDPVLSGFVASLNRPGGNVTGIYTLQLDLIFKCLELLHELIPAARSVATLFSYTASPYGIARIQELNPAATTLGITLMPRWATVPGDFEQAFDAMARDGADVVLVGSDAVFLNNRDQIVALAARHRIPVVSPLRQIAEAGGLASYSTSYPDAFRQVGIYTGRILNGDNPADLPVQQVTKIELVLNLKTAKSLGVTVPQILLARADDVIE